MILGDYYFADPRLALIPVEHLAADGISAELAVALAERRGWDTARFELLNRAYALYWTRSSDLARRSRSWPPPRRRHIAVFDEALSVHPYAQLLNANACTLFACDLDPHVSHPELVAYLLAHADRMTLLGEVTLAGLHNAAWWIERSADECAAFTAAAAQATRPDGESLRALAGALPWLRRLGHASLRPVPAHGHRAIPNTELSVPQADVEAPQRLVDRCAAVAQEAVARYVGAWRSADLSAVQHLAEWLRSEAPRVLICGRGGRVLWDPDSAARVGGLSGELRRAAGAAVRDIQADLFVIDAHTRRFLTSLAEAAALPAPVEDAEQSGYTFMHPKRRMLVYDLDDPAIPRRSGPALPYARAMLGARAVHEWAHLAVDAGWVPLAVPQSVYEERTAALAALLDAAVSSAPRRVLEMTADDLAALASSEAAPAGAALARVLLRRMPDFQANLLAMRYLNEAERETYVRQNVRPLRAHYRPAHLWRMLIRALYEYQYLRFSAVADRRAYFLHSTWFDADFCARGVLDEARFDGLGAAVAALCDSYAVDEARFAFETAPRPAPRDL